MRVDYGECERRVLLSEGGYTNDPRDPGGPTNWGITLVDARLHWKPDATADDVRAMPRSVAEEIYKTKYWDALDGDELPAGVDYTVFDYGVNSGIGRSGKVLRAVLGLPTADWRVDASVIAALARIEHVRVVDAINAERLAFLERLPTWDHFGPGWGRRVAAVKAYSDHLAEPQPIAPPHPENPDPAAKGYGDHPIDVAPLVPVSAAEAPQTVSIDQQGTPLVRSDDPPATQVAQALPPTQRPASRWAPFAALGLGGSGTLDWLHQVNDYGSELASAKFNMEELNVTGCFWWLVEHPVVFVPFVIVGAGVYVWNEHAKYVKLLAEVQQK
jgi:lysozyme family protein